MATKLSSITRIAYQNTAAGYEIKYNITRRNSETVTEITADIKRGDVRAGYININADGTRGISLNPGVTDEDAKTLFSTVLADAQQIFAAENPEA